MKAKAMKALPIYAWTALFFLILSEILLFSGVKIAGDFFYLFVWWPYIFFADGLHAVRTGRSVIFSRPLAFFYMLPWSVTIWLIFELFNFRLSNWHYINLVSNLPVRWAGYALSFATVLPGLFITAELLGAFGLFENRRTARFHITPALVAMLQAAGGLMLILPLLYPRYFFPFVWGGFVLLIDPINMRLGAPSLLKDFAQGHFSRIARLLAAGLICGVLWEFWNFWATAKWIYSVPFVGDLKLFEMPFAGFLGFPPFALECFVIYTFIMTMGGGPAPGLSVMDMKTPVPVKFCAILLGNALFWLPVFYLMDRITVLSFR